MTTGIILAGGDLTPEFADYIIKDYISRGEIFLAAADAGLETCLKAGRKPDLVLGDFDTVDNLLYEYYKHDYVVKRMFKLQ